MEKYVALLRGINVGKAAQVSMADLAAAFADAGHAPVRTLLRSGNVVLSAAVRPDTDALQEAIAQRTGVGARVLLLSASEFRAVAAANPLREGADDLSKLATTFLDGPTTVEPPVVTEPERVVVGDRAVYQYSPAGLSNSQVPASFWRSLGPSATGRNENTVQKLLAMLDAG